VSIKKNNNPLKTIVRAFAALALLIISCDDDTTDQPEPIQGTYTGQFRRVSPTSDGRVTNVTLKLDDHSFSGESDLGRYPAICMGTYTITGDKINFTNECVWTADFDWTLILNGAFEIEQEGNELVLTKRFAAEVFDIYDQYTLTKTK
jgi:hypothetical protein